MLPPMPDLTGRFEEALVYAVRAHAGQTRKGSETPYASHVIAVASLVLEDGGSEDEAIGALLHDTAEDAGGRERLADVTARFGPLVGEIVEGCTDTFETPKPPWRARKEAYLEKLPDEPLHVLRVSCADKVHNARSILLDWHEHGEAVWEGFTAGKDEQRWYYHSLAGVYGSILAGSALTREFQRTVQALEAAWGPGSEAP
jgi:(p)ppGpp synthase/HD superfamily hydrolase